MTGYLELVFAALAYGTGIVLQTVAAQRAAVLHRLDVGLLVRLAGDRVYLFGFLAQVIGFVLAFLARGSLPLFLVQAGSVAAIAVAAVIGAAFLGWRIGTGEIVSLLGVAAGLVLLVGAASPGRAGPMNTATGVGLVVALVLAVLGAAVLARTTGPYSGLALGMLTGVAFAVLAIAGRPLAGGSLLLLPLEPLAWLMIVSAVIGQTLFASALQRVSALAVMVTMESTAAVIAALVGVLALGDQVIAGRGLWVVGGLLLVVGGVVGIVVQRLKAEHAPEADRRTASQGEGAPR